MKKKKARGEYFLFSINKVVSIFLLKKKIEQPVNITANNAKLTVKKKEKKKARGERENLMRKMKRQREKEVRWRGCRSRTF